MTTLGLIISDKSPTNQDDIIAATREEVPKWNTKIQYMVHSRNTFIK